MSARLRSTVAPPAIPRPTEVTDAQPAAPPSISAKVLEYLAPATNTDSNDGHLFQIEIVPDMRFPLLSWLYSLSRIVTNSAYVSSAYASPASAIGYTIVMYVALMYHTDAHHLFATSDHARSVLNDAVYSRFFDMLLDLPVPDFAHNEFADLQAFLPDDIEPLAFLTCLASSSYYHDFGRHFSANVFFLAHNLLASMPGNTPTDRLRTRFYTSVVNTVQIGPTQTVNITPAHLFGRINGNDATQNWLNERIDAMVNSMAIRAVNQNNIVAQVNYPTVALGNANNYNPYTFLTALDHANVHSVTSAMRNLAQWMQMTFPASRPLRNYLQVGSHLTVNHLLTDVALPTWNTTQLTYSGPDFPTSSLTDTALATTYSFLADPPIPDQTAPDGVTTFTVTAQPDPTTKVTHPLYPSTLTSSKLDPWKNPITYETYATVTHLLPRTYIFAPYIKQLGDLGTVIASGKIIESGDLTGIRISVPSPATGLLYENSQFHEGAIRISRTREAFFSQGYPLYVQQRIGRTNTNGPTAVFRGSSPGLRLAAPSPGVIRAPGAHATHFSRAFPGAAAAAHTIDTDHAINVFGSELNEDFDLHQDTKFALWSSMRFRHDSPSGSVIYVLPTLRHIFGARAKCYGTVHPALRIPL